MPRKKRSFSNRRRLHSAPPRLNPKRPPKRKKWHNDSMKAAIQAVKEGQSVSKAARDHGVPKTTLYDRISGKVIHGVNPGPRPYLSNEEEKELGSYLKQCSKIGCGKTRRDVFAIVQNTASDKGVLRTSQVSSGWWRSFLKRNEDLSLQLGNATGHGQMEERAAKAELRVKKAAQREEKTRKVKQRAKLQEGEPQNSVPAKRVCIEIQAQDGINDSECYVRFVEYKDDTSGTDCVKCACGH